jgi:hypothetical protein
MNPATILLIMQAISAAIAAAPKVVEVAKAAKDFITSLFTANLITKEQQDALHAFVDNQGQLALAGIPPIHWTVEADPV